MNRIDHVIEVARSSHQIPLLLSFLVGLFVTKRECLIDEEEITGDNVPATLMERIGR